MISVQNTNLVSANTENRGRRVKAKAFGGNMLERLVWEEDDDVVYLCTDHCFNQLVAGDFRIQPVGFPKVDIIWR